MIPKPCGSGPDYMRFINLLDSTGKLLFGYWLPCVVDPYRDWKFGFTFGRGGSDCLPIPYAVWELSERFWDVVKAYGGVGTGGALRTLYNAARRFVVRLRFLTHTVRQGDNLGIRLFRRPSDGVDEELNQQ